MHIKPKPHTGNEKRAARLNPTRPTLMRTDAKTGATPPPDQRILICYGRLLLMKRAVTRPHARTKRDLLFSNRLDHHGVTMTTLTENITDSTPLKVTEKAQKKLVDLRKGEEDGEKLGLRIEIVGASGIDFTYDLYFEPLDETTADDHIYQQGELEIILPIDQLDQLRGSTLDTPRNLLDDGLTILNPNRPPSPLSSEHIQLEGNLEERLNQLLEQHVNPHIASHGGSAQLVRVENETAFIRMGGGCQGCSSAQATLEQGITSAILDNISEIKEVVDVTDHAAGENPFY